MWAELLYSAAPFITVGGVGTLGWYIRGAVEDNRPTKPEKRELIADVSTYDAIKAGYDAVGNMANDIHRLYHPDGCKCVMCQLRADDSEAEADPNVEYCKGPCFGCTVLTCQTHPDRKPVATLTKTVAEKREERVTKHPQLIDFSQKTYDPEYVKKLQEKVHGLQKENTELRNHPREKVITKTVERKSYIQQKVDELSRFADQGKRPVVLNIEMQGRPIQITVAPQRPPDSELEMWGETDTIKRWHDKPATMTPEAGAKY